MRCTSRLAEERAARGWSQSALAAAVAARYPDARLTPGIVSRWEHGATPSLPYALALAATLGVPVERLFPLDAEAPRRSS